MRWQTQTQSTQTEAVLMLDDMLGRTPIVASMRGVDSKTATSSARALVDGGITVLEVIVRDKECFAGKLPTTSIELISKIKSEVGDAAAVVAGSVSQPEDISILTDCGVSGFLSPFYIPKVVEAAAIQKLPFIPGVETVSEAYDAYSSGAYGIKLFPSIYRELDGNYTMRNSPGFVKYLSAFLPIPIIPSGDFGLGPHIEEYFTAGAYALNIGKQLFSTNIDAGALENRAKKFSTRCQKARL